MAVAASTFTGVDFSKVPAPAVVETLSFETVLANWLATFQTRCVAAGIDYTAILESDPAYKLLEAGAFQEVVLRQRINDAAKAVMVAYAAGADLDNLAALVDVERYILTPGNPAAGTAEVDEGDTALRQRVVLAPQGYSVAGPEGAYVFFAKSADPTIQDVSIDTPTAGTVLVTVLGNAATGVPSDAALAAVTAKLTATSVRPLTDNVVVQAVTPVDYDLAATITFIPGYDQATVTANARAGLAAYLATNFALGAAHTLSGLSAAMFVAGVKKIAITAPGADVVPTLAQAAICTSITLTGGGTES
jgi:phage-related baseplate assembly protein